ncbi:MAG TPA: type II toxin-antitoxin system RelE/ParE family toxin [Burkholderiaceae bacterium]|nr:type II toxin-antitoxin system RelE/ParE family toxin [Burkholderiaceae bacterium]
MARIELAPELNDDFDRIFDHLAQYDLETAAARIQEIVQAFDVLATNPLIGRPASGNKRELIIGRRSRGYVALYRYVAEIDTVFILALRSQREAGYQRGG